MRRRLWLAIGFVLAVAAVAFAVQSGLVSAPDEKSFSLPLVAVEAELAPDGSMRVVEHVTYDFHGAFTYGTRPIPRGNNYTITDMAVSEGGIPIITMSGAPYDLLWTFLAEDERRTFDIAYTVVGAARPGADVADVYWKWVGDAHPEIDRVDVDLRVPPGPGELRAWGHGPARGRVAVRPATVTWRARGVREGTIVEGRAAVPVARLPLLPPSETPRLVGIKAEERAIATIARQRTAGQERTRRDRRETFSWVAPLAAVVGALGFALAWWRWGRPRTPKGAPPVGRYYRDLPDDPPAVVDAFMHWGDVHTSAFGATLLDLAQRRYFTIRELKVDRGVLPDRVDYEFTLAEHLRPWFVNGGDGPPPAMAAAAAGGPVATSVLDDVTVGVDTSVDASVETLVAPSIETGEGMDGDDEEEYDEDSADDIEGPVEPGVLRGFERVALEQVFSTGGVVRQSTLAKVWRVDRRLSTKRWTRFETSVERSLRARGYLLPDRPRPYVVNVGLATLVFLIGGGALLVGAWVGGALAIGVAVVQLSLTRLLRQRTEKGELRYQQWRGVRNFLHDFSQLGTAPSGHLVLWERYLVYAVALGVSEELARALSEHVTNRADFVSWLASDGGGSGYGSVGHFAHGVSADADGSFSPTSASGTGGAFSGGGGGGEGGGGGGGGGIGAG